MSSFPNLQKMLSSRNVSTLSIVCARGKNTIVSDDYDFMAYGMTCATKRNKSKQINTFKLPSLSIDQMMMCEVEVEEDGERKMSASN